MEAALCAALPAGTAVGATACAQADVEIADTIVTSIRKARRFMLSSVFCAGSSVYPLRMRLSNVCSRLHLPPLGRMSPLLADIVAKLFSRLPTRNIDSRTSQSAKYRILDSGFSD